MKMEYLKVKSCPSGLRKLLIMSGLTNVQINALWQLCKEQPDKPIEVLLPNGKNKTRDLRMRKGGNYG